MITNENKMQSGRVCKIIVQDCFIRVATLAVLACLNVFHRCTSYVAIDSYVIFHSACSLADVDMTYEQYISHGYTV